MSSTEEKVRENRLRRMAERRGWQLQKSRRRDPGALGYAHWRLVDTATNSVVRGGHPWDYSLTLDEVEAYLTEVPAMLGQGAVNRESRSNRAVVQGAARNPRSRPHA